MTELENILKRRIEECGPISVHDYMSDALLHPEYGYYQRSNPFGRSGDFITAPEISQMFGELIGLWCVDCWAKMGGPSRVNLIELGPGNGTLIKDALRSTKLVPEFVNAVSLHLVEVSDRLKNKQQMALSDHSVQWHSHFPEDLDGPYIVIANEFFDALPIHQFLQSESGPKERAITYADDKLTYTTMAVAPDVQSFCNPAHLEKLEPGEIYEVCPSALSIMTGIAHQIAEKGGAALTLDYGPEKSAPGDSFQALKDHRNVSALEHPGEADLTAHVDFGRLADVARESNVTVAPITSQGRFLERLGIEARALQLSAKATDSQKEKIASDHKRLVSSSGMGTLFKVLCFHHTLCASPAGFGE
ncbi:class I SAM-dependent methyltransferase [Sneathiella aquimaris]|uniref:class I SAM-dependent methyltransferase n=1 Tax=Sneathiella aquimaris TaxID=2599305 RepID=UPI00146A6D2C|nr:SAM-dependent methyltransferase [Sneathiella aquimaris]